jgi:hypothetical protein
MTNGNDAHTITLSLDGFNFASITYTNIFYQNSTGEVWDIDQVVPKGAPIRVTGFTPAMLNTGSSSYRIGITGTYLRDP